MKVSCALCGLLLAVAAVSCAPIAKREAQDELSPLNEVYVFEMDKDQAAEDGRTDRDKRKIGVVKLGVTNGIINFVFGKLDSFLDSKTRALNVLDESNRAKNAAFGIDNTQSATGQFISNLVSQKIQATTGSIGPIINSATTLLSGASNGLSGAFVSKLAPLSSIVGGLSGGAAGAGAGGGASSSDSSGGGAGAGNAAGIFGNLLSSKLGTITSLSQSSGGSGGGAGGSASTGSDSSATSGAGINLGAFANLAGGETVTTTTEDIPEFDRRKVSLDIPGPAFGTGFTVLTNVSKVINSLILNSARRTQTLLELFKPFFRGTFAIKGLPSDNPK
ncbi:hypothetical protein KM043_005780 [Ampulex compressa]|nr:hypothetical protein KM043_005780 [Ampulex compressa]